MSRRNSQSIIDRALAMLDPDERAAARAAIRAKTPHERDELRRVLAKAFAEHDAKRRDSLGLANGHRRRRLK